MVEFINNKRVVGGRNTRGPMSHPPITSRDESAIEI